MKPAASVVIPNWNGVRLLKICLPSLRQQSFKDFEVIVIDNGSTDGSVKFINRFYSEVKVIELEKNIGFSPAVNLGIKHCGGRYIILLNNDTRVDKDCLKFLVKVAQAHPEVGMVAAKLLQFHHPSLIDSAGDWIDTVGHANNIGFGKVDGPSFNKAGPVFLVTGGGSLIKREVFNQVGMLDEDYFAYMEDVDFSLRAQFQGFKAWYEPKAVIYHIHKATSSKNKALTEYLQFRNMTQTIIKDFPTKLLLKNFNWLKIILVNVNTIRYLSSQGYLFSAIKAEWYILINLPKLLWKRWQIQSQIKVPLDYIIANIKPKKVTLFGLLKKGF